MPQPLLKTMSIQQEPEALDVPAPANGATRTFPSRFPAFALDRVWVHPAARLVDIEVDRSRPARIASDHLPLVARVLR